MKITKDTQIGELLDKEGEKAAEILMKAGLSCVGCPMSRMESIEDGCLGHGMSKKQIKDLVEELNK
jgi:hybrid cluster-associated redox disulfide protein